MKKWLLSASSAVLFCLAMSVQANDRNKDDRDKLGLSTLTVPAKKTSKISTSQEISTVFTPTTQTKPTLCDAELDLTYYQNDTIAEVSTHIASDTCTNHQGRYRIRLFYTSEQGGTQRLERELHWSSTTGKDSATENFTLGDNAELLRVNSSVISCECVGRAAEVEPSQN